jgi:hypothetical protein
MNAPLVSDQRCIIIFFTRTGLNRADSYEVVNQGAAVAAKKERLKR